MVLIYVGIIPKNPGSQQTPKQQDRTVRAKLLLHLLRNDTVVLPTISVAELLVPVPDRQKGALTAVTVHTPNDSLVVVVSPLKCAWTASVM